MKPTVKKFMQHRKSINYRGLGPGRSEVAAALGRLRKKYGTKKYMSRFK